MSRLLANLTTDYDLVILDAPPLLPVADASVLATEVAGVLVVARAGRTRCDQMIRAVERLKTVDARILGVLLNMVPGRRADHYDYSLASRQRSGNRDRRLGLRWRPATGMRTVDFPPGSEVARSHSSAPTAASLLIPRVAPDQETLLLPTGAEGVDDLSGPPTDPPAGRSHLGPFRP
jgi:Mrp family chromosome partitioning ATPase